VRANETKTSFLEVESGKDTNPESEDTLKLLLITMFELRAWDK
jgi:hypothetical protein